VPAGAPHDWWQVGEDEAQVVVDPDPRALAMLSPDGRLAFDTGAAV